MAKGNKKGIRSFRGLRGFISRKALQPL